MNAARRTALLIVTAAGIGTLAPVQGNAPDAAVQQSAAGTLAPPTLRQVSRAEPDLPAPRGRVRPPRTADDPAQQAAAQQAAAQQAAAQQAAAQQAAAQQAQLQASRVQQAVMASRSRVIPAGDPVSVRGYARSLLATLGQADQFGCLSALWQRESNWSSAASNAQTGAYGIPQALPGSKMSSAGSDWTSNPRTQIRWGVNYISQRYTGACTALAHSDNFGWY